MKEQLEMKSVLLPLLLAYLKSKSVKALQNKHNPTLEGQQGSNQTICLYTLALETEHTTKIQIPSLLRWNCDEGLLLPCLF